MSADACLAAVSKESDWTIGYHGLMGRVASHLGSFKRGTSLPVSQIPSGRRYCLAPKSFRIASLSLATRGGGRCYEYTHDGAKGKETWRKNQKVFLLEPCRRERMPSFTFNGNVPSIRSAPQNRGHSQSVLCCGLSLTLVLVRESSELYTLSRGCSATLTHLPSWLCCLFLKVAATLR